MLIEVTKKHIKKGKAADFEKCAVALALLENFPNAVVDVDENEILIIPEDGDKMIFNTPARVSEFINQYDENAEVKPFKFNLPIRK